METKVHWMADAVKRPMKEWKATKKRFRSFCELSGASPRATAFGRQLTLGRDQFSGSSSLGDGTGSSSTVPWRRSKYSRWESVSPTPSSCRKSNGQAGRVKRELTVGDAHDCH